MRPPNEHWYSYLNPIHSFLSILLWKEPFPVTSVMGIEELFLWLKRYPRQRFSGPQWFLNTLYITFFFFYLLPLFIDFFQEGHIVVYGMSHYIRLRWRRRNFFFPSGSLLTLFLAWHPLQIFFLVTQIFTVIVLLFIYFHLFRVV